MIKLKAFLKRSIETPSSKSRWTMPIENNTGRVVGNAGNLQKKVADRSGHSKMSSKTNYEEGNFDGQDCVFPSKEFDDVFPSFRRGDSVMRLSSRAINDQGAENSASYGLSHGDSNDGLNKDLTYQLNSLSEELKMQSDHESIQIYHENIQSDDENMQRDHMKESQSYIFKENQENNFHLDIDSPHSNSTASTSVTVQAEDIEPILTPTSIKNILSVPTTPQEMQIPMIALYEQSNGQEQKMHAESIHSVTSHPDIQLEIGEAALKSVSTTSLAKNVNIVDCILLTRSQSAIVMRTSFDKRLSEMSGGGTKETGRGIVGENIRETTEENIRETMSELREETRETIEKRTSETEQAMLQYLSDDTASHLSLSHGNASSLSFDVSSSEGSIDSLKSRTSLVDSPMKEDVYDLHSDDSHSNSDDLHLKPRGMTERLSQMLEMISPRAKNTSFMASSNIGENEKFSLRSRSTADPSPFLPKFVEKKSFPFNPVRLSNLFVSHKRRTQSWSHGHDPGTKATKSHFIRDSRLGNKESPVKRDRMYSLDWDPIRQSNPNRCFHSFSYSSEYGPTDSYGTRVTQSCLSRSPQSCLNKSPQSCLNKSPQSSLSRSPHSIGPSQSSHSIDQSRNGSSQSARNHSIRHGSSHSFRFGTQYEVKKSIDSSVARLSSSFHQSFQKMNKTSTKLRMKVKRSIGALSFGTHLEDHKSTGDKYLYDETDGEDYDGAYSEYRNDNYLPNTQQQAILQDETYQIYHDFMHIDLDELIKKYAA